MTLDGETVVVTGASRGLGAAVARAFGSLGAHVAMCARSAEDLDWVAADVIEAGGSATTVRADVRDEYDVELFAERAAREGESASVRVVVANAGVAHGTPGDTPLGESSYAAFDDTLRTNVRGVHATIRECLPHLTGDARVLVPSGSVADEAQPGYGAYAVSKAAAEAVVRQYAAERPEVYGVLHPGVLATDLTDGAGRDPADAADMVAWAATDADPDAIDGRTTDLRAWKRATRD